MSCTTAVPQDRRELGGLSCITEYVENRYRDISDRVQAQSEGSFGEAVLVVAVRVLTRAPSIYWPSHQRHLDGGGSSLAVAIFEKRQTRVPADRRGRSQIYIAWHVLSTVGMYCRFIGRPTQGKRFSFSCLGWRRAPVPVELPAAVLPLLRLLEHHRQLVPGHHETRLGTVDRR